ncbi:hypothetical protein N0V85_000054 [Neurospora sp. IMI 360204]|nr:hypothetical protein N0V85_000054 [Neurospora sp. IMI 360204]
MRAPDPDKVPEILTVSIDEPWGIASFAIDEKLVVRSLFFEARWYEGGKESKAYSRWFTIIDGNNGELLNNATANPKFKNPDPVPAAKIADEQNPTSTSSSHPTASSSITTTSTPQPTTGDNTAGDTGDNTGQAISGTEPSSSKSKKGLSIGAISGTEPSSSKSKKSLSIGAIVGIAIACGLLGLALIGGIVFFCLRRRQKQNALGGGTSRGVPYGGFASGGGRNGGDELMAAKEANTGVIHDLTSTPHSPYSDDGHNHQQHLMGMGGAGANNRNSGSVVIPNIGSSVAPHVVLPGVDGGLEGDGGSPVSNAPSHHMQQQQIPHDHQSGRSYTMYSDHQSAGGGGGSPTILHSGGGAPSLTHGGAGTESNRGSLISQQQQGRSLSTPYAHLVEEGMTEEEIRRLEEEERQLDAAIEQHAGGRRGSRNL